MDASMLKTKKISGLFQGDKPFIDQKLYHIFDKNHLDYLIFETSEAGYIDADKYTLYNLTADKRVENALLDSRLDMMDSWVRDMNSKKHCLYARESLNGSKAIVSVTDPFDGSVREMINMASNDYLNLTQHPGIAEKVTEYLNIYGGGSGGSPMLNGTSTVTKMLQNKIAAMKGCESAVVFSSGYGANIGTITSLLGKNDLALYDMYAHASLIDGGHNTNVKFFKHNDPESLKGVLDVLGDTFLNKIVIVDGIYSMDGDICKLNEILDIAHFYGAWVLVDEAHSTGVIGENGHGTMEHYGLQGKVDIVTGTFSKAVGAIGGYVCGSRKLTQYIQYTCRPYIFSTAPFIPSMVAAYEALNIIEEDASLREKLWENIRYTRNRLGNAGFNIGDSETAILPLIIGNDYKVKEMAYQLHKSNVYVNPVPYPAVPRKQTRVRLTITAEFSIDQLDYAITQIERIARNLEIIN